MRSIAKLELQYAHRFYGFRGEAQYLHGHSGHLTIEVEDSVNPGVNMVFPCNEIQKTAWDMLKNFDHALILREDDPLPKYRPVCIGCDQASFSAAVTWSVASRICVPHRSSLSKND